MQLLVSLVALGAVLLGPPANPNSPHRADVSAVTPDPRPRQFVPPGSIGQPLTAPSVLVNESSAPHTVEVTITAAVTHLELTPGVETKVFAYNGQVPGPTLEVWEGDSVIVHFRNELPEPTTIHWHGIHLPFHSDGSPFDPVKPGEQYDYVFTVERGTAGTYW